MIFIQDEKNQILTTNIWLNLVRQGSTLQTQQTYERCFTRLLFRMKGTMFRVEGCYYLKCKVFLHQKGLFTRSRHSPFQILSDIACMSGIGTVFILNMVRHRLHVWHRHSLVRSQAIYFISVNFSFYILMSALSVWAECGYGAQTQDEMISMK